MLESLRSAPQLPLAVLTTLVWPFQPTLLDLAALPSPYIFLWEPVSIVVFVAWVASLAARMAADMHNRVPGSRVGHIPQTSHRFSFLQSFYDVYVELISHLVRGIAIGFIKSFESVIMAFLHPRPTEASIDNDCDDLESQRTYDKPKTLYRMKLRG